MQEILTGQMSLFGRLPHQPAPDLAVSYAATLGPERHPARERAVIAEAACRRLLPEVMAWLGDTRQTPDAVLRDLTAAVDWDAYCFTRNLERERRWEVDRELTDILDGYAPVADEIEDQMVRAWVAARRIVLSLPVGTRVRDLRPGATPDPHGQDRLGTITAHDPDRARYIVQFDADARDYNTPRCGELLTEDRLAALES